jgi:hypothetical protein
LSVDEGRGGPAKKIPYFKPSKDNAVKRVLTRWPRYDVHNPDLRPHVRTLHECMV